MHLLYVTFGPNPTHHLQAQFSIFSFWAKKSQLSSINIITDQPGMYANIKDRVNVILISEETLQTWKGPYDFFWRVKIKAIEKMCDQYQNEPILYLDTDTFLYGDFETITSAARKGQAFMHENEGRLGDDKSKTSIRMFKKIHKVNYSGIVIGREHCMWNAGVVLTPNTIKNNENLLALQICDEMCRQGVTRRLIEQFALSLALQETYGLLPLENCISHYWSNKEAWNSLIEQFFIQEYFSNNTLEQSIDKFKDFNFLQQPVKLKIRNTNTRLKALVDKLYPAAKPEYAFKSADKTVE